MPCNHLTQQIIEKTHNGTLNITHVH